MSATMARQGLWVYLELSNMHLAWNIVKIAKGGLSFNAMEKTQYLIMKPHAKVQEQMQQGVEFPGL
jgi:hypothetical protein